MEQEGLMATDPDDMLEECVQDRESSYTDGIADQTHQSDSTNIHDVSPNTTRESDSLETAGLSEKDPDDEQETKSLIPVTASEGDIPYPEVEEAESKSSEGEVSPPADDSLGRRKRKPSRYHDSMFDIPTNLMNINRTINPDEFRAFHTKGMKQKEKTRKILPMLTSAKSSKSTKLDLIRDNNSDSEMKAPSPESPEKPSTSYADFEDDVLDANYLFKFKMRKDHIVQNAVGGPTAYKCDICLMTFPRSFSLRRHYTRRHINPLYVAPKGDGTAEIEHADRLKSLNIDTYGSEVDQFLYACKMCSKDLMYFKHKNDLHVHCLENHSCEPRRPVSVFKCEICKRSYSTRHELERHKRTHSGERPYACSYCHKTFPTSTNARRHERTHTGDRPHICKVCNKGFIQRTDMVKHLRSIHKMKVTKTKAQKSAYGVGDGRSTKNGGNRYGMDSNNEFQEDIDFAAYLRLDQHDSGTLMGEGASRSPFAGKDLQSNKSNNHQSPGVAIDLKLLPPSQIIGEDGRPEKIHRCPDCSKMFTSNINLRRHHKLKHERNQIYQSAEPVSMVVEKFKIMDDAMPNVAKEGTPEKQIPTPGDSENLAQLSNKDPDDQVTDKVIDAIDAEMPASEESKDVVLEPKPSLLDVSNKKEKLGKLSKLNSIVQRLADKISAEKPSVIETEAAPLSSDLSDQPIAKLEELENQMFGQSTTFDVDNTMSPKRKKRKPTNVQHVPTSGKTQEMQPEEIKHRTAMPDKIKHNIVKNQNSMKSASPSSFTGGIYKKVFEHRPHSGSLHQHMKMYGNEDFMRKDERRQLSPFRHHPETEFHPPLPTHIDAFHGEPSDLSRNFMPFNTEPLPPKHSHYQIADSDKIGDASRMETFLSQCYSSKKRDIPQNAILDRNVPVRDANAMNRKLKYNMRNLSNERLNEHLPPSAYFSQRDSLAGRIFSPNGNQRNPIGPQQTDKKPMTDADAPLDLRVPSKKEAPDYVVRDDGVLDFSQKTRNSLGKASSSGDDDSSKSFNSESGHSRVKIESGTHKSFPMFQDKKYNDPYSRHRNHEDIPSWLRASHQQFLNRGMGMIDPPINSPMDHRRELLHGRPSSSKPQKPYKFHPMEFKPPYDGHSGPPTSKSHIPPHLGSYREHPYMPMPAMGHSGSTSSRRRNVPPSGYGSHREDPRMYCGDKMLSNHHPHKHYLPNAPCSLCNTGPMLPSRHQYRSRDIGPPFAPQVPGRNWQPEHRRNQPITHSKMPPNHLRPILPKGGWKDDPRPIPSSIQRLALKKSQGPSPFDRWDIFDDRDMMTRCIKKAQQSLKKEGLKPNIGIRGKEMSIRDTVPCFKSNPSVAPYMPNSRDVRLSAESDDKVLVTSPSSLKPAVSPFVQKPTNSPDRVIANPVITSSSSDSKTRMIYGMLNLSSSNTPSQSVFDTKSERKQLNQENTDQTVREGTERDLPEDSNEREKLTMTPGLESTNDAMDSTALRTDSNIPRDLSGNRKQQYENCETKEPNDLSDSKVHDNVLHDIEDHPSPDSSDIGIRKSTEDAIDSRQFSAKVPSRRHTHACFGNGSAEFQDELSAEQRKVLKRSCSNDSNHGDSLSDEGDATSRKLIKKLKLRVIKSPGSEHKKYWTLVDQEKPKHLNMPCGSESAPELSTDQILDKEEDKEHDNSEESYTSDPLFVNQNDRILGETKDAHHDVVTEQDVGDEEVNATTSELCENPEDNVERTNLTRDLEQTPDDLTVLDESEHVEKMDQDSDLDNVLTGTHVETALSAIASPSELNNESTIENEHERTSAHNEIVSSGDTNVGDASEKMDSYMLENIPCTEGNKDENDEFAKELPLLTHSTKIAHPELSTQDSNALTNEIQTEVESAEVANDAKLPTEAESFSDISDTSSASKPATSNAEKVETEANIEKNQSQARKTRSAITGLNTPAKNDKSIQLEKKAPAANSIKKVELSPPAGSASNRLRRSVRIRKSSSDKDTGAKKKK